MLFPQTKTYIYYPYENLQRTYYRTPYGQCVHSSFKRLNRLSIISVSQNIDHTEVGLSQESVTTATPRFAMIRLQITHYKDILQIVKLTPILHQMLYGTGNSLCL